MAQRGRKPGFVMSQTHRDKIRVSNILNALQEHVDGRREMTATQVTAGLGLLKKVLPDLAAVEHSGEMQVRHAVSRQPLTSDQWTEDVRTAGYVN